MTTAARSRYLLKLSRPRFWLYLAGPVAVGVVYASASTADLFTPTTLTLFAYFLLPANVLLYGVNDVFDADVDEKNPKKEGREVRYGGDRTVPTAVAASGLLLLVPAALTLYLASMVTMVLYGLGNAAVGVWSRAVGTLALVGAHVGVWWWWVASGSVTRGGLAIPEL